MVMLDSLKARDIVLVVDDSPETLGLLTDALEEAEVTVLVALEGAKALALVDEVTPDVILMDAIMPGMDGFETCKRLKEKKNLIHVPVIFHDRPQRDRAYRGGVRGRRRRLRHQADRAGRTDRPDARPPDQCPAGAERPERAGRDRPLPAGGQRRRQCCGARPRPIPCWRR